MKATNSPWTPTADSVFTRIVIAQLFLRAALILAALYAGWQIGEHCFWNTDATCCAIHIGH